jgi:hypothetical protein
VTDTDGAGINFARAIGVRLNVAPHFRGHVVIVDCSYHCLLRLRCVNTQ